MILVLIIPDFFGIFYSVCCHDFVILLFNSVKNCRCVCRCESSCSQCGVYSVSAGLVDLQAGSSVSAVESLKSWGLIMLCGRSAWRGMMTLLKMWLWVQASFTGTTDPLHNVAHSLPDQSLAGQENILEIWNRRRSGKPGTNHLH